MQLFIYTNPVFQCG